MVFNTHLFNLLIFSLFSIPSAGFNFAIPEYKSLIPLILFFSSLGILGDPCCLPTAWDAPICGWIPRDNLWSREQSGGKISLWHCPTPQDKPNHFLEPHPILHAYSYIITKSLQSRWLLDALEAKCSLCIFFLLHRNSCASAQQEQEEEHSAFSPPSVLMRPVW